MMQSRPRVLMCGKLTSESFPLEPFFVLLSHGAPARRVPASSLCPFIFTIQSTRSQRARERERGVRFRTGRVESMEPVWWANRASSSRSRSRISDEKRLFGARRLRPLQVPGSPPQDLRTFCFSLSLSLSLSLSRWFMAFFSSSHFLSLGIN